MSKYDPLYDRLQSLRLQGKERWQASFAELEDLLGFRLPQSAYSYPAWWSNEKVGSHVQTHAWMKAGWKTEQVSLTDRTVYFSRGAA